MAKKPVSIDLDIKMATKAKDKKADRPVIDSPKMKVPNPDFDASEKASKTNPEEIEIPTVDRCIDINQQIDSLAAELSIYKQDIVEAAAAKRKEEEKNDTFVKTIDVQGTTFKMQVQFKDAYSKMDIAMKVPLKQIFGADKYAVMFEEEKVLSVIEGKEEELKTLLGDRYTDFIHTDESVKPTKDFQHNYFAMRKSLKADQTATVQKILDACQSSPAVKFPG